ncbi:MAG: RES family NAD+ phosphorylase [Betaproteobacteria bacterium]|nr:RES family NAD+ phosphorylase [Betaproteobacteria bacterium]
MRSAVAGADRRSRVTWAPSYRLVPSRFPPVQLFDRVADAADLEAVIAIEGLTNDRLRDEIGEIALVASAERISGPGTSAIMAAFTHVNPEGGRFTDGTYGAYYAAHDLDTAVREVSHHRGIFLARTREAAGEIDLRCYLARLSGEFVDIRGLRRKRPDLYDPVSYARSRLFARRHRDAGATGIVWESVRNPGGECAVAFSPRALKPAIQGPHVSLVWDGERIVRYYVKSRLEEL